MIAEVRELLEDSTAAEFQSSVQKRNKVAVAENECRSLLPIVGMLYFYICHSCLVIGIVTKSLA